jgi:hypothetical protein
MQMDEILTELVSKARAFEQEAHAILAVHETSVSRVVLLEDTYSQLSDLSLRQDGLIRQALRCIENALFRAAHVMAWAGFIDFVEEKLASDGLKKLRQARPNWRIKTMVELRERVPEYQLIEACRDVGLCSKNETKALLGLLNKRNECAHPSNYFPGLNESLGYISELLQRIELLQDRQL